MFLNHSWPIRGELPKFICPLDTHLTNRNKKKHINEGFKEKSGLKAAPLTEIQKYEQDYIQVCRETVFVEQTAL